MSQGKPQSSLLPWEMKLQRLKRALLIGPLSSELPPQEIRQDKLIIGVDGGVRADEIALYDLTLGDGDSAPHGTPLMHQYSVDKAQSDLSLALQLLPSTLESLELWGFWGGRDDHQLINLGEIFHWHKGQTEVRIYRPQNNPIIMMGAGDHKIQHHGVFSLLSFDTMTLSIAGACRYPLPATQVAPFSSHLLSNFGDGEIIVTSDRPFYFFAESK